MSLMSLSAPLSMVTQRAEGVRLPCVSADMLRILQVTLAWPTGVTPLPESERNERDTETILEYNKAVKCISLVLKLRSEQYAERLSVH